MSATTGKSIWAVAAGILATIIVTTIVDLLLHAAGVYPAADQPLTDALCVLATSYRIVIGVACAYLTARLAPDRPLWHATILGYVGTLLGLVGVVATWNLKLGPHWYPIALTVLALPQCRAGGKLYERKHRT